MTNGFGTIENEEYLESNSDPVIKEEPISEEETPTDLPMDCMLCTKQFVSLSGLKAHVITHHNYKTVKRKFVGGTSPEKEGKSVVKYVCNICKRNFTTSTDLKVHEVCHDKFTCFACDSKFESFNAVTQHRRWCKAKDTVVKPPKTLTDILKERKAQKQTSEAIYENDQQHWECRECLLSFRNIFYYKQHSNKHNSDSPELQLNSKENAKKMFEIEINIKQEVKDENASIAKKEKADADYKKIETELESMFENPCESEKLCANVSIDSVNRPEKFEESDFRKRDQDNIEKILSSVNTIKYNNEHEKVNTGKAFKQDSENKNESASAFKDSISNLKERSTDNDSNMEINNEAVLEELSKENDSQNNEKDAHPSETKQIEDKNMEPDASDINHKHKNAALDDTDKCDGDSEVIAHPNETKQIEDNNMELDASDNNNKDENTALVDTGKCDGDREVNAHPSETKQIEDKNMEIDASDINHKYKNAALDDTDKCNGDSEVIARPSETKQIGDNNMELDASDNDNKDKNTALVDTDKCDDDSEDNAHPSEKKQIEDMELDSSDNNKDKTTALDDTDKTCDGESEVNEKTEIAI